jgi:hypothetical protein
MRLCAGVPGDLGHEWYIAEAESLLDALGYKR